MNLPMDDSSSVTGTRVDTTKRGCYVQCACLLAANIQAASQPGHPNYYVTVDKIITDLKRRIGQLDDSNECYERMAKAAEDNFNDTTAEDQVFWGEEMDRWNDKCSDNVTKDIFKSLLEKAEVLCTLGKECKDKFQGDANVKWMQTGMQCAYFHSYVDFLMDSEWEGLEFQVAFDILGTLRHHLDICEGEVTKVFGWSLAGGVLAKKRPAPAPASAAAPTKKPKKKTASERELGI